MSAPPRFPIRANLLYDVNNRYNTESPYNTESQYNIAPQYGETFYAELPLYNDENPSYNYEEPSYNDEEPLYTGPPRYADRVTSVDSFEQPLHVELPYEPIGFITPLNQYYAAGTPPPSVPSSSVPSPSVPSPSVPSPSYCDLASYLNVRISDRELDVFDKDDFPAIAALMRYLLDAASCTKNRPDLINLNLVGLVEASIKKLDEALEGTHTFTLDLHHNIACMIDLLLNGNPDGTAIELIHTFFTSLRVVSTDSVEGIGLIPLMETESPVFVKVSKTKQRDNIIHEAFVGTFCTNLLRNLVPNFTYVYGYTECDPPIIQNKREVSSWCENKSIGTDLTYLFMENVKNAIPLRKFITTTTLPEVMNILLQITQALQIAWDTHTYQHNDLHYENVMIRTFSRPVKVPFYFGNVGLYSPHVPYIIDYGFSTFSYRNHHIRSYIFNASPSPLGDMFKLICFLGEELLDNKMAHGSIYTYLNEVAEIFNRGSLYSLNTYALSQPHSNYTLDYPQLSFYEFYQHIISLSPNIITIDVGDDSVVNVVQSVREDFCGFYQEFKEPQYYDYIDNEKYFILISNIIESPHLSESEKVAQIADINSRYSPADKFSSDYASYTRTSDNVDRILKRVMNAMPLLYDPFFDTLSPQDQDALKSFIQINNPSPYTATYESGLHSLAMIKSILDRLLTKLTGDRDAISVTTQFTPTSAEKFNRLKVQIDSYNDELDKLDSLILFNREVYLRRYRSNSERSIWVDLAYQVYRS